MARACLCGRTKRVSKGGRVKARPQFPTTTSYNYRGGFAQFLGVGAKVCGKCGALVVDEAAHTQWHKHYHVDQSEPQVAR